MNRELRELREIGCRQLLPGQDKQQQEERLLASVANVFKYGSSRMRAGTAAQRPGVSCVKIETGDACRAMPPSLAMAGGTCVLPVDAKF